MANLDAMSPNQTANPSASGVMSLELRRQLQRNYEQAIRHLESTETTSIEAHQLLTECLLSDPGNLVYVDTLIRNLRRSIRNNRPSVTGWLTSWFRNGAVQTAVAARNWPEVVRASLTALGKNPLDHKALGALAVAAAAGGFEEAEIRYLRAAVTSSPDDLPTLRQFAESLTKVGDFRMAQDAWEQVLRSSPNDDTAKQILSILKTELISPETSDPESNVSASGFELSNPILMELRTSLKIAELLEKAQPGAVGPQLIPKLRREINQQELAGFYQLCDRFPADRSLKRELAVRLKRSGNYPEAIKWFTECLPGDAPSAEVALEIGECQQFLKQFQAAVKSYERAISLGEVAGSTDNLTLALYRAAVLTAGLQQLDQAEQWFKRLLSLDPNYKDASARLDKLHQIRDKR